MRAFAAVLLLAITAAAVPAEAQVTCYLKRCAEYADGSKICELTPVTCGAKL